MRPVRSAALVCAIFLGACWLGACGPPQPAPSTERQPAPVTNDTLLLPATGQTSAKIVPDHILGEPRLPGGTLGEYVFKGRKSEARKSEEKKYELFIVRADTNQKAAFLLLDLKNAMGDAAYLPHMGGYSGMYKGAPLYVFAKAQFLAGVAGLPQAEADTIARQLAARLR